MTPPNYATDPNSGSARINLRRSADPRLVLADRVRQLYGQMPLAIGSTLVVSAVAAYELREGRYIFIDAPEVLLLPLAYRVAVARANCR